VRNSVHDTPRMHCKRDLVLCRWRMAVPPQPLQCQTGRQLAHTALQQRPTPARSAAPHMSTLRDLLAAFMQCDVKVTWLCLKPQAATQSEARLADEAIRSLHVGKRSVGAVTHLGFGVVVEAGVCVIVQTGRRIQKVPCERKAPREKGLKGWLGSLTSQRDGKRGGTASASLPARGAAQMPGGESG